MSDLLPPNSTATERAISLAMARVGDIPTPAGLMWDAARCPAEYLPWLAWAVSVDDWDADWSEGDKRAVIASSAAWHRIKGTRPAMMTVLASLGHADAVLTEDHALPRYGAGWPFGRGWQYGPANPGWADYWIEIQHPLTRAEADRVAARLAETAPARCRLRAVSAADGHRYAYGAGDWVYGPAVSYASTYLYGETHG